MNTFDKLRLFSLTVGFAIAACTALHVAMKGINPATRRERVGWKEILSLIAGLALAGWPFVVPP